MDVAAVLDHVGGDVIVVNAFSGRVDAGEARPKGVFAAGVAVRAVALRAVLRGRAGARATVSAVVALKTTTPRNGKVRSLRRVPGDLIVRSLGHVFSRKKTRLQKENRALRRTLCRMFSSSIQENSGTDRR